jgi:DNA-binding NarL/FixJ family response regulator
VNKSIRILIVDDHTLFRESLARLLESEVDLQVVAHCASVEHALKVIAETEINVVLLDYDLGTEVGTNLLAELGGSEMDTRVILVTAGLEANEVSAVVNAGVSGIFLKHNDPLQLVKAIRRVSEGEHWWDTEVFRKLATMRGIPLSRTGSGQQLTERQNMVLRGILDGLSNKEIATRMQASESAIKATIQEIFAKAGVKTRSQMVRIAIERYSGGWP